MAINTAVNTDNINNLTASGQTTSSKNAEATNQLFSNYEQFIKLLTVQLQNQDPTKPLETDQLTSQIAQLSQVEQTLNTNKSLETLISLYNQSQFSSTVGYIGKMLEAPGNLTDLANGQAPVVYNLAEDATTVDITISDTTDKIIWQGTGTKNAGRNQIIWDGTDNNGDPVADGTYKIAVVAKDAGGKAITSSTSSAGRVTSVETLEGAAYLAMGDILVPFNEVISVREMPVNVNADAGT
jgi:flagellar basal-body rod modification protein FlgD